MANHTNITIGDFRKKVLDKKNKIADEVFLVSGAARHYIENLVEAVTKKYNSSIKVNLNWGNSDDVIAYASGRNELHINVNNSYVTERDSRAMKLVMMKAITLHECGHLLFTDFHILNSTKKVFMEKRQLFPAPKCQEYNEWQIDASIMTDEQIEKWFTIWHKFQNSIEDGFIEWMILKLIPGDGKCLMSLRELQKAKNTSVKQQRQSGLETKQILFNLILMLSKYGTVLMDADDKEDPAIAELLKDYDIIQKATREQKSYDRTKLINELFCKFYKFFKEEDKKEEEQKNKQEDNQNQENKPDNTQNDNKNADNSKDTNSESSKDNNADNSFSDNNASDDNKNKDSENNDSGSKDNASDNKESKSNDTESNNSSSDNKPSTDCGAEKEKKNEQEKSDSSSSTNPIPDPSGLDVPQDDIKDDINTGSGSVLNDNNINNDTDTNQQAKDNQQRLDKMMQSEAPIDAEIPSPEDKRMAESIAESIAQEEVKNEAEKELAKELEKEAAETDYSSYNKGIKPTLSRSEPSKNAYNQYDEDEEAIKDEIKKLVREIKNKIKDRQNGGKINALYQGRYLDNHSLYRFDQRVLCKNDLPEDIPNMAFALVVDGSGSMKRESKSTYARRTALMLYEFGRELDVPVMVYSHNCSSQTGVRMQALADFGSVDNKDKYRICDYAPTGCNRDGLALRFCSKKLSQRPEETKICFIISDGLPSAYNSSKEAYADIKDTLMEYSKKGVRYIACGLGNDAGKIKDIYQQGLSPKVKAEFLDCSDPSKLPVGVVRAIKELIK